MRPAQRSALEALAVGAFGEPVTVEIAGTGSQDMRGIRLTAESWDAHSDMSGGRVLDVRCGWAFRRADLADGALPRGAIIVADGARWKVDA